VGVFCVRLEWEFDRFLVTGSGFTGTWQSIRPVQTFAVRLKPFRVTVRQRNIQLLSEASQGSNIQCDIYR
jgi:hypothetical protein